MALTWDAKEGELITLDPGDARGPFTIRFPDTDAHGATISVKSTTADMTTVTLESLSGTASIEDPNTPGTLSSSPISFTFGDYQGFTWVYHNGPNPSPSGPLADTWFAYGSVECMRRMKDYGTLAGGSPVAIDASKSWKNFAVYTMTGNTTFNITEMPGSEYALYLSGAYTPTWSPSPAVTIGSYSTPKLCDIRCRDSDYILLYH